MPIPNDTYALTLDAGYLHGGALTVLSRTENGRWLCRCDCGRETVVRPGCLTRGVASCGVHHWRQEIVGYDGAHDRVASVRGKASGYRCVDPSHYQHRCVRCHRIFDCHPFMRTA